MVARLVNFVGMGLAGIGGMLLGLDTSIDPLTGFRVILSVFAAAVVGGLGSIPGAVVGALTIGVAEELSLLSLAPAYRTAVGFVAILRRAHPAAARHPRRAGLLTWKAISSRWRPSPASTPCSRWASISSGA